MFEKKKINEKLADLKKNLENQKNWNDFEKTNKDLKKLNYFSNFLKSIDELQKSYNDTIELIKITDENTNADMYLELEDELKIIKKDANTIHIETLMSGKADSKNVLLEIHSGAGGVEAQDWVEMLLRMYSRWAESKSFKLQIIDQNVGEEAGLKSVTYFVICSLPLTVVICFFSTGKIKQHKASSNSFFLDVKNFLKALGSEPLFRRLLLAYFINGAANGMPASLFLFFVNNRLETPGLGGLLILIYFVSAIVCIPVWMVLCKKISKHRLWCYAMIYASIIFAFTIFLGSGNWIAFLAICILSGFALGADLALPSSMQADLVDLELLRSGSRRTGAFFSIWSVATKAAVAISSGMGLIILSWSGFTSVGDNTELSLFTLSILYAGVPIVLKLLAVYFIWNFPIDLRQHKKIIDSIESKNFPG